MGAEPPFETFLAELDGVLARLDPARRALIWRELQAHLADAAAERGGSPEDASVQRAVLVELGTARELGALYLDVYFSLRRQVTIMAGKRLFDLVLALLHLVLLAPVLLVIAVLVKLDGRGPVLYKDPRLGRNGRPFDMLKFRTMAPTAGGMRVTRVGRWLRRWSLDELPQLWNVVAGDMSLIGPRPAAPGEPELDSAAWRDVLGVRPGITGLAQLETVRAYPKTASQLELDAAYIQSRSLGLDVRLLLRTVRVLRNHE